MLWSMYAGNALIEMLWHLFLITLIFVCVILHECGHAYAARRYDVPIRDILILPIGGLARLEFIPKNPVKEVIIAIAGPLVNLVLAILFFVIYLLSDPSRGWDFTMEGIMSLSGLIAGLAVINLTLFVFNLIPAYPMDGGRILRAGLTPALGRFKATVLASYIAQFISFGFMIVGYFYYAISLVLIGIFIFLTARWERKYLIQVSRTEEE